jgi:hypothetical protein
LSAELRNLGPGAFALCHDYQQAGALAFYLDGQPKTYYAASFYKTEPGRRTQYDIWVGDDLSPAGPLVGRNAVFLGRHDKPFPDLLDAFERVEGVTIQKPRLVDGQWVTRSEQRAVMLDVVDDGTKVRTFRYFRCYGFKGMTRRRTHGVALTAACRSWLSPPPLPTSPTGRGRTAEGRAGEGERRLGRCSRARWPGEACTAQTPEPDRSLASTRAVRRSPSP